jgi:hypothetical protein
MAAVLIPLAGCAYYDTHAFDPTKTTPGGTPSFQEGYRDGCHSAFAIHDTAQYLDLYRRDSDRMDHDPDYHSGWYRGKDLCLAYLMNVPFYAGAPQVGND